MFATFQLKNYIQTFDKIQQLSSKSNPNPTDSISTNFSEISTINAKNTDILNMSKYVSNQSKAKVELKDFKTFLQIHSNSSDSIKITKKYVPDYEEFEKLEIKTNKNKPFSEPTQKLVINYKISDYLPKKNSEILSSTATKAPSSIDKSIENLNSFCEKLKALDVSNTKQIILDKMPDIKEPITSISHQSEKLKINTQKAKNSALSAAAKKCAEKFQEKIISQSSGIASHPNVGEVSEFVITKQPSPVNIDKKVYVLKDEISKTSTQASQMTDLININKKDFMQIKSETQEKIDKIQTLNLRQNRSKSTDSRFNTIMSKNAINLKEIANRIKQYAKSPMKINKLYSIQENEN